MSIQKLSLLNIILAVIYVLIYLKSGTFNSTAGIFVIIVFNWLALRSFELDYYRWQIWHYAVGGWALYFIGTLVYGSINILSASIEFNFISDDTLFYLVSNFVFCALVLIHFLMYAYRNYVEHRRD